MSLQQSRRERFAEALAEQSSADAARVDVRLQRPRDVLDHRIAQLKAICDLDAAGIRVQLACNSFEQRVRHTHDQSGAGLLGLPRRRRARRNDVEVAGHFAAVTQPPAARARDFHRRSEVHADDRVRQRGDLRDARLKRTDRDGDGGVAVGCRGASEDGFAYGTHVVASTHSATAVPRIQRITPSCASSAFAQSVHSCSGRSECAAEAIFGAASEPL